MNGTTAATMAKGSAMMAASDATAAGAAPERPSHCGQGAEDLLVLLVVGMRRRSVAVRVRSVGCLGLGHCVLSSESEQVDEREHQDPDEVHEVPEQADDLDVVVVAVVERSADGADERH